jgi:hypothetical protein
LIIVDYSVLCKILLYLSLSSRHRGNFYPMLVKFVATFWPKLSTPSPIRALLSTGPEDQDIKVSWCKNGSLGGGSGRERSQRWGVLARTGVKIKM